MENIKFNNTDIVFLEYNCCEEQRCMELAHDGSSYGL
jgi:hypothetical protein